MACSEHPDEFWRHLADFNGSHPVDAVICPFTESAGAGMTMPIFALWILGGVALAYSVHQQNPAPLLVAVIFGGPIFLFLVPGIAVRIVVALTLLVLTGAAYIIYSRSRDVL